MRISKTHIYFLLLTVLLSSSCKRKSHLRTIGKTNHGPQNVVDTNQQISAYIRNIHQDKDGHLWFGTNGDGVAHYNGDRLHYYSNAQGFNGQQVTGMTEDSEGNIWFATDQGVVKYEWSSRDQKDKTFVSHLNQLFIRDHQFWSIFADSDDNIWAGSATGIFRFDGKNWKSFELPFPEKVSGEFITKGTTWSISEDREGNMWFSTNGFGAYKYDGQSFTQYTKKDGLTDDSVDNILQDSKGNMWFGTRYGGASKYDGKSFINYTQHENGSIQNNEVCVIYEDKAGNIWLSSEGFGVYRYNGQSFTNYSEEEGLKIRAVQTIFEDREGRFWVGGGGGLYLLEGETFVHVSKNGPWK